MEKLLIFAFIVAFTFTQSGAARAEEALTTGAQTVRSAGMPAAQLPVSGDVTFLPKELPAEPLSQIEPRAVVGAVSPAASAAAPAAAVPMATQQADQATTAVEPHAVVPMAAQKTNSIVRRGHSKESAMPATSFKSIPEALRRLDAPADSLGNALDRAYSNSAPLNVNQPLLLNWPGKRKVPSVDRKDGDEPSQALSPGDEHGDGTEGAVTLKTVDPLSRAKIIARLRRLGEEDPAKAFAEASTLLRDPNETRWDVRVTALRTIEKSEADAVVDLLTEIMPNLGFYSLRRIAISMVAARLEAATPETRDSAISALKTAAMDSNASVRLSARAVLAAQKVEVGPEPETPKIVEAKKPGKRYLDDRVREWFLKHTVFWGRLGFVALSAWTIWFLGWLVHALRLAYVYHVKDPTPPFVSNVFGYPLLVAFGLGVPFLALWGSYALLKHTSMKKVVTNVEKPKERFADIAGIDESVAEIAEVVKFLKNPNLYESGGRAPRGVLLVGPPGTGKTLLAKAVSGETHASFIYVKGSDIFTMWYGESVKNLKEKFREARAGAPTILFFDEFDAIAGKRSTATGGGTEKEDNRVVDELLAQMDGFENDVPVIVMAATNHAEALDPAALRPGRFDRKIQVQLPDTLGREAILSIHAGKVKLDPDVDLKVIAQPQKTGGMSGAFLANIINEAANLAGRRGRKTVSMADLNEAADRESMGIARSIVMSVEEKKLTAYHETGHALVELAQGGSVDKATILPRGQSGGHISTAQEEDKQTYKKSELKRRLATAMGGIVAEQIVLGQGDHTTGPSSDLSHANDLAESMVTQYGMGKRTRYQTFNNDSASRRSEAMKRDIELDVQDLIDEAWKTAHGILTSRHSDWERLANGLLDEETLTGDQIKTLIDRP